jgi:hypothetical protein
VALPLWCVSQISVVISSVFADSSLQATPGQYSRPLQPSKTSLKAVFTKSQQLAASSDSAPKVEYHLWTPPLRPTSPDDELPWSQRIEYSNSTTPTSSDDDDESPAETSLPLVPKPAVASVAALEKDLESDLFAQSHLSNIFVPMATAQLQAARTGSNHPSNAGAGAMQLLAYRSPSVRYDKGLHGAFSPATTVHLALPHAAAVRTQGKPRLPLPASAKAMPRQLQSQQPQPQNTPLPLHRQQQRSRVISQPPPPRSVTSPPVIGLDLALMPPADHRDSAMSPRNSISVKTPARPSLLAPVDIPRRVSQSHTIWKPVSAPTPSPISEGPPQPSVITQAPPEPSRETTPIDTPKLSKPPSTSSVSIHSSVGSATPSVPASATSSQIALNNERAEIRARTLSSTNLAQRFKTDPPAAPPQSRKVSPKPTVQPLDNQAEKAPSAVPAPSQSRPAPTPIQPSIMFPADEFEVEVEEAPAAPLRVINVTNDFATDSVATVPLSNYVEPEKTVQPPTTTARPPSPVPSITVVPSTPVTTHQLLGATLAFPTASVQSNRFSVSPAPSPTVPEAQNNFPKHTSLPPPARSQTQSTPVMQTTRVSLTDPRASASYSGHSERKPSPSASRFPPPNARTWLPRNPTVPTPLSPTSALPRQSFQEQQTQASQRLSSIQQQQGRFQHAHSRSDPPATPMRSRRSFPAPIPSYDAPSGYYSSDDDDPSKWAPYPEAPSSRRSSQAASSRRSSRSSRSSFSVNRNSIYGPHAEEEEEDGGLLYAPPSISLPNLRPILQGPGETESGPSKKITFAVPPTETNKPSQAAGGRRKIRRRSNSTDSVIRGPKQIPWLQESDVPKRGGLITVSDPFGYTYVDEGRYDVVNHPELVPAVRICSSCIETTSLIILTGCLQSLCTPRWRSQAARVPGDILRKDEGPARSRRGRTTSTHSWPSNAHTSRQRRVGRGSAHHRPGMPAPAPRNVGEHHQQ